MNIKCYRCNKLIGCYATQETIEKKFCFNCKERDCFLTSEVSHGVCDTCYLEIAITKKLGYINISLN